MPFRRLNVRLALAARLSLHGRDLYILECARFISNEPKPTLPGARLRSTACKAGTARPSPATSTVPEVESCVSVTWCQRPLDANAAGPLSALIRTRSPPYT